MKIGIVGSGQVGSTLGKRWAAAGHSVSFGSRNPDSAEMRALGAVTLQDAVAAGDVVLLATPWPATRDALRQSGNFAGKIVIDAVNPLSGLERLEVGTTTSAAEQIATWI